MEMRERCETFRKTDLHNRTSIGTESTLMPSSSPIHEYKNNDTIADSFPTTGFSGNNQKVNDDRHHTLKGTAAAYSQRVSRKNREESEKIPREWQIGQLINDICSMFEPNYSFSELEHETTLQQCPEDVTAAEMKTFVGFISFIPCVINKVSALGNDLKMRSDQL